MIIVVRNSHNTSQQMDVKSTVITDTTEAQSRFCIYTTEAEVQEEMSSSF